MDILHIRQTPLVCFNTSLEVWKLCYLDKKLVCVHAFQYFLRGMETALRRSVWRRRARFNTSLEVWKHADHVELITEESRFNTSLEVWKRPWSASMYTHAEIGFNTSLEVWKQEFVRILDSIKDRFNTSLEVWKQSGSPKQAWRLFPVSILP